mmetsp:Transcript_5363/g.5528  ORF Transcript_5363/g.5528 Transcript_5363/m.5528 type:complete len:152 (-) Transcript_5363:145-600(-)
MLKRIISTRNICYTSSPTRIILSSLSTSPAQSSGSRFRDRPPVIQLTDNAAARIKELIEDKDDCVGIKIGVKRRGCNGYSYNMNYATQKDYENTKDDIVESHGLKILVDPKAVFFIVGTVMNYEETELASEFTFVNPNAKGECGCGESFNV